MKLCEHPVKLKITKHIKLVKLYEVWTAKMRQNIKIIIQASKN